MATIPVGGLATGLDTNGLVDKAHGGGQAIHHPVRRRSGSKPRRSRRRSLDLNSRS